MELGQLPDDQLGVRPVQAVRLVLARRVREALCSETGISSKASLANFMKLYEFIYIYHPIAWRRVFH